MFFLYRPTFIGRPTVLSSFMYGTLYGSQLQHFDGWLMDYWLSPSSTSGWLCGHVFLFFV